VTDSRVLNDNKIISTKITQIKVSQPDDGQTLWPKHVVEIYV